MEPSRRRAQPCKTVRRPWGWLAFQEAVQLREAGLEAPILIFGYSPLESAETLIDYELTQTVYSTRTAAALSHQAGRRGKKIKIHIKMDSGMGRLGLLLDNGADSIPDKNPAAISLREVEAISRLADLEVEGIFTHFATADSADKSYANRQLERFIIFLETLRREGLNIPIAHAANSGALIDMPDSHLDMVRPGIATYGLYPSDEVNKNSIELIPVMTLKSRIIHLKKVPAGFSISYGSTFKHKREYHHCHRSGRICRRAQPSVVIGRSHAGSRTKSAYRRSGLHGPDNDRCGCSDRHRNGR